MPLYFAYGSNMSRAVMRRHCPQACAIGCAELADHRFVITRDGYASIVPRRESVVHGIVWQLAAGDFVRLDLYESIATGLYRRKKIAIRLKGRLTPAWVYVGRSGCGSARAGYLDLVLAAARDWKLPDAYVSEVVCLARP